MQDDFILTSPSTGKIFCSSLATFEERGRLPTTPLPHYHAFWKLWRDHLSSLTESSKGSNTVIDALVALGKGDPEWKNTANHSEITARQEHMRKILSCNPPDVVLLTGMEEYGFRYRRKEFWQFICINEDYVDLWVDAVDGSEEALGLTALLRASIDHELGHWVQTLVCTVVEAHHNLVELT